MSRRFAVEQLSGGKLKLRPIDDLSESLINASTSRTEAVTPHEIDMVCRALVFRLRHRSSCGLSNNPVVKATDLRKAYNNLHWLRPLLMMPTLGLQTPSQEMCTSSGRRFFRSALQQVSRRSAGRAMRFGSRRSRCFGSIRQFSSMTSSPSARRCLPAM